MRIETLKITNFRGIGDNFQEIKFPKDKKVTIFLGDNGSGKTSVLDAVSYLISPFISQFPGNPDKMMSLWDIHIDKVGESAPNAILKAEFRIPNGHQITETRVRKLVANEKGPESDLKEIKQYAHCLFESLSQNKENVQLPIFAHYGTERGRIQAPERTRNFKKLFKRWDCYNNAMTPSTDFKNFFAWFYSMEDEERREGKERRDYDYKLPSLNAVREALNKFVGKYYNNPRIEIHPLRFVMSDTREEDKKRNLRIEQLSDGFKIVVAMVADIAARMAEANPGMENPLLSNGIILIDEIDLHLHPKWQRIIVNQLVETFPNIQFILTTHSPVVISGAAEVAQAIKLSGDPTSEEMVPLEEVSIMNIGQILLSSLFGLPSLQSPQWDHIIQRRDQLLALSELSNKEKSELEELEHQLSVLKRGDSAVEIRTMELLSQIAASLRNEKN